MLTYNVKILFQFGVSVLYSVWVWSLELISSSTQNGSDLPPKSAAANPVAPNTLIVKWPTSRVFCKVFFHEYLEISASRSLGSSLYEVRSVIVSLAVVPLIVSNKKTSAALSSSCCQRPWVVSRDKDRRSIVHRPYWDPRLQTVTSSIWSSSNRCRSNCSSHRDCHEDLLLNFSLPNLYENDCQIILFTLAKLFCKI